MQTNQSRKNSNHVLLTERDQHLLNLLYGHELMSLGQVERYAFTSKAWPTILNRLAKLEGAGFVKRLRVNRLRHPIEKSNVSVVLQLGQKGFAEVAKTFDAGEYFDSAPSIRQAQLDHDLLLVDVIERLKKEYPSGCFMSGRRFVRGKSENGRVPDAVMIMTENPKVMAIELELNAKSEKRYRQIVLSYRLARHFEKVLFIGRTTALNRKIQAEVLGYKVQESQIADTGKCVFMTLADLFSTHQKN